MTSCAREWRGVYPVLSTPFTEDDKIDSESLDREVAWLYENGAKGVVVAMVSEVLRLSNLERDALVCLVCEASASKGQVVVSVGAESTLQAIKFASYATEKGADAVMAIPPLSTGVGKHTLDYYTAIADSVEVPLVVQDASAYVGSPLNVSMQASLVERFGPARVMFKPEAPPTGPRISALLQETEGQAQIFDGSGGIGLVDSYHRGVVGTMPGPELCWAIRDMWQALEHADDDRSYELAGLVALLVSLQSSLDAYIAVEKYLLVQQRIFRNSRARVPVDYVLDEATRMEIDRLFTRLSLTCSKSNNSP